MLIEKTEKLDTLKELEDFKKQHSALLMALKEDNPVAIKIFEDLRATADKTHFAYSTSKEIYDALDVNRTGSQAIFMYYRDYDDGDKRLEVNNLDSHDQLQPFILHFAIPIMKKLHPEHKNLVLYSKKPSLILILPSEKNIKENPHYLKLM